MCLTLVRCCILKILAGLQCATACRLSNAALHHHLFSPLHFPASGGCVILSTSRLTLEYFWHYSFPLLWLYAINSFLPLFPTFPLTTLAFWLLSMIGTDAKWLEVWLLPSPFPETTLTDGFLIAKINGLICSNHFAATGFGNCHFLSEIALLVLMKIGSLFLFRIFLVFNFWNFIYLRFLNFY